MAEKRFVCSALVAMGVFTGVTLAHTAAAELPATASGQSNATSASAHGVGPRVTHLPNGIVLRIDPGSIVETLRPTRLQLGPGGTTPAHVLQLTSGRVQVSMPARKPPLGAVLIRAPRRASAVIKGGDGVVMASAESVTVAAMKGEMLAALGDEWRPLPEGQARSFDARDPSGKRRAILPAPKLQNAHGLTLAVPGGDGSTSMAWTSVAGAKSYRVEIDEETDHARTIEAPTSSVHVGGMNPGQHMITIAAVDESGLEGTHTTFDMNVVGIELPPGARFVADGIELRRRQRIRFLNPEGLELSYGSAPAFMHAPSEVGLARAQRTLVRIRRVGTTDELPILLTPHDVHADISLGPALARWPHDAIDISISVRDGKGQPLTPALETDVRVNMDPVRVNWTRRGNALVGRLSPRADKGPWVVRVQVKDELGHELGYNFLEVAPSEEHTASSKPRHSDTDASARDALKTTRARW